MYSSRFVRNGILGLIVGDALGASAEFGERWMRDLDPVKEMRSGGVFEVPAGGWTDDTSMTLATIESLKRGYSLNDMMNEFVLWLREGKFSLFSYPIGIGKQILKAIERYEQTGDVYTCGGSAEGDNGNGSLMRIMPVCLYGYVMKKSGNESDENIIHMIHEVSGLTHNHPRSKIACGLYYFIVCSILDEKGMLQERLQCGINKGTGFYRGLNHKNASVFCEDYETELEYYKRIFNLQSFKMVNRDEINSSGYVVDSLEAALWCLITENTYRDSLLKAVNLGLDTDTIAAIAGGLAGLYYGEEGIPLEWRKQIQRMEFIERYLKWEEL